MIVKPNVGGSGALCSASSPRTRCRRRPRGLDLGIDRTALVQEYLAPAEGAIVRVEVSTGSPHAIKIFTDPGEGFNLCPPTSARSTSGRAGNNRPQWRDRRWGRDRGRGRLRLRRRGGPRRRALPAPAKKPCGSRPTTRRPPIVEHAIRLVEAGGLDVGGVEYLVAERDGQPYFYDLNALSNFVTDAPAMLGFDPTARFVDFLLGRAGPASVPPRAPPS